MSALPSAAVSSEPRTPLERYAVQLHEFGELEPISRLGGQGRVHRPARSPAELSALPLVVKLYRRTPTASAARVLAKMVAWSWSLEHSESSQLHRMTTWPLAIVSSGLMPVGIAMHDVSSRFATPFVMPSGRRERVLLALEHLLGDDGYLHQRGLDVSLDTTMRARVAERVSGALGYLHRHAIVVSDLAPSNLLVAFDGGLPSVCFIDCDSMVFRGEQGLAPVETGDWEIPAGFAEQPRTRSADVYKLGLLILRLFARSHDARVIEPHLTHVPAELRELLVRALAPDAANRPPAGEWQRALRELLVGGSLHHRYPGPVPRSRPPRPAATENPVEDAPRVAPAPPPRIALTPPPRVAPAPPPRVARAFAPRTTPTSARSRPTGSWLRPAVVGLWILAGAVVFVLIFARLFAEAIPSETNQQQRSVVVYPSQQAGPGDARFGS